MSFGWSAGDIAAAITLAYNLIQALDTSDGAAGDYREAVSFLRDLKRTLEPLQSFTACNASPTYGRDIEEQVAHIKEPVEKFLAVVLKYEPSLGAAAKEGHHRHIFRKLQWYMFMSKKVLSLRKKIESHMRIIDTLMHRLTVDAIRATQQQLPETLRIALQQTLRPELIAILQESLLPLNSTLLTNHRELEKNYHNMLVTKWTEHSGELSTAMREIKEDMKSSQMTQIRIESCLRGDLPNHKPISWPATEQTKLGSEEDAEPIRGSSNAKDAPFAPRLVRESLMEVYYLVFLYLGHFLQNLFLVLSRIVQPTQALMPVLLAQYNISFLDAFGRLPRILPFEYFRSFQVLQAFIRHEFKDLPGSAWVDQGRYLVLSLANNRTLDEQNWASSVAPGSTIAMSMVVRKRFGLTNSNKDRCPEPSCTGTWTKSDTQCWATCPVCEKQILNYLPSDSNDVQESMAQESSNVGTPKGSREFEQNSDYQRPVRPVRPTSPPRKEVTEMEPTVDEDISFFKRIVQEIIDLRSSPSNLAPTGIETIGLVLSRLDQLAGFCDLMREYLALQEQWKTRQDLKKFQQGFDTENLKFRGEARRILALSSPPDMEHSSVTSLEHKPWQMENVSQSLKLKLGLDSYSTISYAILSVSQALDAIISLIPHALKDSSGMLLTDQTELAWKPGLDPTKIKLKIGFQWTNQLATLSRENQKFEGLICRAEDFLNVPRVHPLTREYLGSLVDLLNPSDRSWNDELEDDESLQLKNLEELQAAIKAIEQHREDLSHLETEDFDDDDGRYSLFSFDSDEEIEPVSGHWDGITIRKKSGELVRPALRPLNTHTRPYGVPGTPPFLKQVHFDSRLEDVKDYSPMERPLAIGDGGSPDEPIEDIADLLPFVDEDDENDGSRHKQTRHLNPQPRFPLGSDVGSTKAAWPVDVMELERNEGRIPSQEDWDPVAHLQQLAQRQSDLLASKLFGAGGRAA